jgi:hypothetical protein
MKKLVSMFFLTSAIIASVCIATGQQRNAAAPAANSADWPAFGGDNTRTNANMAPTRITAANLGAMVRQQVAISAPIDAARRMTHSSAQRISAARSRSMRTTAKCCGNSCRLALMKRQR